MGETQFKVGDKVKLTGEGWKDLGLFGKTVKIEGVEKAGDPYFFDEDYGERHYVYNVGGKNDFSATRGKNDFSATLVEEAAPVETKKKLREYTDLKTGDVVVIAGVEKRIKIYSDGHAYIHPHPGNGGVHIEHFSDMLVDEVRYAKRTVKEFVVRADASGPIVINGVRFRVEEREVEE